MTTRQTLSYADDFFGGSGTIASLAGKIGGRKGAPVHMGFRHTFGVLAASNDSALFASGSAVQGALTLLTGTVGAVMDRGSARTWMGNARNLIITSSGNESDKTYAVVGTDIWGRSQRETITGPNATIVSSAKTWATVTSITASATSTGNVKIGFGNVLGLPFLCSTAQQILPFINGKLAAPYNIAAEFTAIGTAETRYITTPTSGVITQINGVSDAANGTSASTVTLKNGKGGTSIATVAFGSSYVAGVIQASSAISSLGLVRGVSNGQIIEVATDGTGDGAGKAKIDMRIDPCLFTAGISTDPATATTGDPLGKIDLGGGPDATATFAALVYPDRSSTGNLFGIAPYNG